MMTSIQWYILPVISSLSKLLVTPSTEGLIISRTRSRSTSDFDS